MVTVSRATRNVIGSVVAPAPPHRGWVHLLPLTAASGVVTLEMSSAVARSGGQAIWEEIDRPKRQNALGFKGISLYEQSFTVLFEGATTGADEPASVQPQIDAMLALTRPLPGEAEPPVLNLDGPVWGRRGAMQWTLRSAEEAGEARRRETDGYVWQVEYRLTLTQYVAVDVLAQLVAPSPAEQAKAVQDAAGTGSAPAAAARTYTVAKGDTLSRIAQRELGNASRWRDIATLNGLTNPNLIRVGQVLKLP